MTDSAQMSEIILTGHKTQIKIRKPVFAICEQQRCRSVAHSSSLVSTFVVPCLDSIMPLLAVAEISSLYLASVAAEAGLYLTWLQTPKTGFLLTRLILCGYLFIINAIPKLTFLN